LSSADLNVTKWGLHFAGRFFPASIGKTGITSNKREGDNATPSGNHKIISVLYRPDRVRKPCDWAKTIKPYDIWSDDVKDPNYNRIGKHPYGYNHEVLSRPDPLYDVILLTDWNWPLPTKGKGSAIFVHSWRKPRHPTEGCVALASHHLLWITKRLKPYSKVIVR
jgi:L,D-peptidoglycan transpeptidase YkuD (ErfK/YbiS/YcfS/YnhG family)|tara:strand:+ start:40 stop:534 length:495 start_codon:yes stop_codon:yes gene_type:complete